MYSPRNQHRRALRAYSLEDDCVRIDSSPLLLPQLVFTVTIMFSDSPPLLWVIVGDSDGPKTMFTYPPTLTSLLFRTAIVVACRRLVTYSLAKLLP